MQPLDKQIKLIVESTGRVDFSSEKEIGKALFQAGVGYYKIREYFGEGDVTMGSLNAEHDAFLSLQMSEVYLMEGE